MRLHEKQTNAHSINNIYGANLHRFMEIEGDLNSLEIAEELGVSLKDVKKLKEKMSRS